MAVTQNLLQARAVKTGEVSALYDNFVVVRGNQP